MRLLTYLLFVLVAGLSTTLTAQQQQACCSTFELFGGLGLSQTGDDLGVEWNASPALVRIAGFGAGFALGKKLVLRTSLQYAEYGDDYEVNSTLRFGSQHDGMGGFDPNLPTGEPARFEPTQRLSYLEGLAALRYYTSLRRKVKPFFEGGLSLGARLSHQVSDSSGEWSGADFSGEPARTMSVLGRVGVGAEWSLTNKVAVYGMAVGQYHLRSILNPSLVSLHPWSVGLEFGARFSVCTTR